MNDADPFGLESGDRSWKLWPFTDLIQFDIYVGMAGPKLWSQMWFHKPFAIRAFVIEIIVKILKKKRWELPAKLPQKSRKLPQKPANSRKSRKDVELSF